MAWRIEIDKDAVDDLEKITTPEQVKILKYIRHLTSLPTPRSTGKPLKGSLGGLWRYRTGNYRILCKIEDTALLILVLAIGHRKDVYKDYH